MAIRLERLYKHVKQIYQMKLIAGEGGLRNIVRWVHMIEDEEVANFLRGNELIFTTGIGHADASWLTTFTQGLIKSNASGLVVNVGPYIEAIPAETIELCQRANFPLFTIPWQVRLVDITREFCYRIINSEQNEMGVSSAFKNAIFFPEDISKYQAQLERHGFQAAWNYCTAVIAVTAEDESRSKEYIEAVRFYVENIINRISEKYSIFVQNNRLTIVFANFKYSQVGFCVDSIIEYYQTVQRGYKIHIGIGQNEIELTALAKSYKQAASVLSMAAKNNWCKVYYKDLGIYKILLSAGDSDVLREFYQEILGRLAENDRTYNTDYMDTLKCYLENDASVQAVAKITFVHRNTINYKLGKIKEITGCNIASFDERLKMMLAFKIRDIL